MRAHSEGQAGRIGCGPHEDVVACQGPESCAHGERARVGVGAAKEPDRDIFAVGVEGALSQGERVASAERELVLKCVCTGRPVLSEREGRGVSSPGNRMRAGPRQRYRACPAAYGQT